MAILSCILVLGCIGGDGPKVTTTTQAKGVETTLPIIPTTTLSPDALTFREATSSSDMVKCESITDARIKDICIRDIAFNKGDLSLCDKVSASDLKDTCIYKIAVKTKNKALCSKISMERIRTTCEKNA